MVLIKWLLVVEDQEEALEGQLRGPVGVHRARGRVLRDEVYEARETFQLRLRRRSTLYPDSVLAGPLEISISILDRAPGVASFAQEGHSVSESESVAFVELLRSNGTADSRSGISQPRK